MIEAPSAAGMNSPSLVMLDEYWHQQRAGREMPLRADIDPICLKPILPKLLLARIEYAPVRILYTVVGTHCVTTAGLDYTGYYLDELDMSSEADTDWPGLYLRIIEERRPIFGTCRTALSDGQTRPYVAGLYPLADDAGRIGHMLCLEDMPFEIEERLLMIPTVPLVTRSRGPAIR